MEKQFKLKQIIFAILILLSNSLSFADERTGPAAANDEKYEVPVVQGELFPETVGTEANLLDKKGSGTETKSDTTINTVLDQVSEIEKSGPDITAPFLVKKDGEANAGALTVTPQPQNQNALDIIRQALHNVEMRNQEKAEKRGWLLNTAVKITPENLTFFIGTGLVTFNSVWIKSHGDPLAMERHILSIKDPIAWVSFGAFMLANGFYIDFRSKTMDQATKMQMMKRLSYQGMAVGSLASSFVSDLGQSGKMCVDYWILGRNDTQSIQACNEAWKHWTTRNKFQQYFPQIVAMWASQAATEFLDSYGKAGLTKLSQVSGLTSAIKKIADTKAAINYAKKLTGAEIILTYANGTWRTKAIKKLGHLTSIVLFVEVDHLMSPYLYRPLNNVVRPLTFKLDALAINNFVSAADQINWEDKRIPEMNPVVCTVHNPNCLDTRISKEIENFSSQMQQWREHLNSDAETDIAGWMELTKKLLNQVDYSYKFYKTLLSSFFELLNIGDRIQTGKNTSAAARKITMFPLRIMPLFGVSIGDYEVKGMPIEDVYLLRPSEIQEAQVEHIYKMLYQVKSAKTQLEGASLEKFNSLVNNLSSTDVNKIGVALIEINKILGINSIQDAAESKKIYSVQFLQILSAFRKALGNPYPIVNEFSGLSQAFAINSVYSQIAAEADFKLWSISDKFLFGKASDLLTYKMFCGKEKANLDKLAFRPFNIQNEVNIISPQYDPPALVRMTPELKEYCNTWRKTRELKIFNENLYGQKIGQLSMKDYFMKNFKYEIIGDFTKSENANNYEKWWIMNGRQPIDNEFKKYDEKFKILVEKTRQNIFNDRTWYNRFADHLNQSQYLKSNIKESLQFETNFYLQMINRALTKTQVTPLKDKYSFMKKISETTSKDQFASITNTKTIAEVQKIQELLNKYYPFILQEKVSFDEYIAHSKKIDTAINEVLVLAGVKISSKTNPKEVAEELAPLDLSTDEEKPTEQKPTTPSSTGTETSQVAYKDVENLKPNLRQRAIISSVKGLRSVESEIRRFIRMKVALSQGLELDSKEFMEDFKNVNRSENMATPAKANPYGQRN